MSIKTYDPAEVSVIIGGHIVSGYGEDTFVEVERNEDMFTRQSGADGEQSRSKSNDLSGTVTITLKQTSESNDVLTGYAVADEVSNAGLVSILIKDNNGTELHSAETAWVRKQPTSAFGRESGERVWVLETGELTMKPGGIVGASAAQ